MVRGRDTLSPRDEKAKVEISIRLNALLKEKGISAYQLSKETKIAQSTLSDYVNGKTLPKVGNIQKIADYFNIKKSELDSRFAQSFPIIDQTVATMKKLDEPKQKNVLNYATDQLEKQSQVNEPSAPYVLSSEPIDITKIPGYMEYEKSESFAPILGDIAAGYDIMAEENFDGWLPVSAQFKDRKDIFWLHIRGESMESLIHDGAFGLFEKCTDIADGLIGAVLSDDGGFATVKRIYHEYNEYGKLTRLRLAPENEKFDEVIIDEDNPAKVIGRLLETKQFF